MKHSIIAAFAMFFFTANAGAAETLVLQQGDVLEIADQGGLSVPQLRSALREYGYHSFGTGDHFGHIIKITAVGPDRLIYRLKINMNSYKVTHVRRVRHVY